MHRVMAWGIVLLAAGIPAARGQSYFQTSSVLDGTGGRSAGDRYENIAAAAQPGGIAFGSAGRYVHYAGFLGTFILQPHLDTDRDGVANELDDDNDDDLLADRTEIAGVEFSPVTPTDPNDPDGDGDGMNDGDEAVCGTDPWDDAMLLRITDIVRGSRDEIVVTWQARDRRTYRIYRLKDPAEPLPGLFLAEITADAPAATPPWYVVDATYEDSTGGLPDAGFYYITIEP